MLREIKNIAQRQKGLKKRWFSSTDMDLFVWYNVNKKIVSYQLTYNKPLNEKALTWSEKNGYLHRGVDNSFRTRTPLLVGYCDPDPNLILSSLKKNSEELESSLVDFIASGIEKNYR